MVKHGCLLLDQSDGQADCVKAVLEITNALHAGSKHAAFLIGMMRYKGTLGIDRNHTEAKELSSDCIKDCQPTQGELTPLQWAQAREALFCIEAEGDNDSSS